MRFLPNPATFLSTGSALACLMMGAGALAQDSGAAVVEDDEDAHSTIIVTATMRQGGAQDIKHFRSISVEDAETLPSPASLTLEGLLGEHDLSLPVKGDCEQLFCINAQAIAADLTSEPDASVFVGLGFETGVDPEAYRQRPVSLIAVVDRSGSMSGQPIERVKEGLHAALKLMGGKDRFGIVIYGSDTRVHLPVMDVEGNKDAIAQAIDAITIDGSTYMEAGMKLGYATAREELEHSNGTTRLILFSDENANVGDTSADGFMGQANSGAEAGIGLTSIGVGRIFDGRLASKISSVKGGNLFFVAKEGGAGELFEKEFRNMVNGEVARDIAITITPAKGFRIANVYGVPENIVSRGANGSVTASIGSAFLSSNGGGIYASMTGEGDFDAPGLVAITYTDTLTGGRGEDTAQVEALDANPPAPLRMAQMLVEQYEVMNAGLTAYQQTGDAKAAQASFAALSERMNASGLSGLESEIALVDGLNETSMRILDCKTCALQARLGQVVGDWEVRRYAGVSDISRGDFVEISADMEFITERNSGRDRGENIWQSYQINEKQLYIEGTKLVFHYRLNGDTLRLRNALDGTMILLKRRTDT